MGKMKMEQMKTYLRIRHWDYWWGVYQCGEPGLGQPSSVEFALSDDREGEKPFFSLEFYNLSGLGEIVEEGLFLEREDPDYPELLRRKEALERGELDYVVGALYYEHFAPDLAFCNQPLTAQRTLLDLEAPRTVPHAAVLFLREEWPLTPDVVKDWVMTLARPLFGRSFSAEIADVPTREEALASWQADHRF